MREVLIEHVSIDELPAASRAKLPGPGSVQVIARIEHELPAGVVASGAEAADPAFGIWRDRQELDDLATYLRRLRAPRYGTPSPDATGSEAA